MRKFRIIIDEICDRAKAAGFDTEPIKDCKGRAQLLMTIHQNFYLLYPEIIGLDLLKEMYSEEELNRQHIYTCGHVDITRPPKNHVILCGNARAFMSGVMVYAYDNTNAYCWGNSTCVAAGAAHVTLKDTSRGIADGECMVECADYSILSARGKTKVIARNLSRVSVTGACEVEAMDYVDILCEDTELHEGECPKITLKDFAVARHNGSLAISFDEKAKAVAIDMPKSLVTIGTSCNYTKQERP